MDRFTPSTENPVGYTPEPGTLPGAEDGNAAPADRESYVGNDIMSGTQEGTEKAQVSLDPAKVAEADRMRAQDEASETEEERARRIKDA